MDNRENRQQQLANWADQVLDQLIAGKSEPIALTMVSGDASFRRYFRSRIDGESFILVDAPPEYEDCRTFVRICNLLRESGMLAPKVFSVDYELGFMLLMDFGDELYLDALLNFQNSQSDASQSQGADQLYKKAIDALILMQSRMDIKTLDPYSREELRREMALFDEWFCRRLLNLEIDDDTRLLIEQTYGLLEDAALAQPQVAVHRDYHSRNLMILNPELFGEDAGPGVVDFQDAVCGAYTYDLVSLLRDCYIRWPAQQVQHWADYYLNQAMAKGIVVDKSEAQFRREFDLMGLQRHLKVMGIFSRLSIRDNKSRYLADIPLVIDYFLEVSGNYPELQPFHQWFTDTVLPVARRNLNLDT